MTIGGRIRPAECWVVTAPFLSLEWLLFVFELLVEDRPATFLVLAALILPTLDFIQMLAPSLSKDLYYASVLLE